jgi:predicted Kef-type K+ transport protein
MSEQQELERAKQEIQMAIESSIGTHLVNCQISMEQIGIFSFVTVLRSIKALVEGGSEMDPESVAKLNFSGEILSILLDQLVTQELQRLQNKQLNLVRVQNGKVMLN